MQPTKLGYQIAYELLFEFCLCSIFGASFMIIQNVFYDSNWGLGAAMFIAIVGMITRLVYLQIPLSLYLRIRAAKSRDYTLKNAYKIIISIYCASYFIFLAGMKWDGISLLRYLESDFIVNISQFLGAMLTPYITYKLKGELFEVTWAKSRKLGGKDA
ncbi:hypothetical protein [Curvivirga aplysinae]|uniref:hypothetical protein n=1 Tax=Curvivirga aplysinae TaxID=2529852 RepID=UPI0012BD42FA|nr:hypothetical protein [Curvivirga aplysinae]MTI11139.1 hypothetical protein [Curvivirga aplysinae]